MKIRTGLGFAVLISGALFLTACSNKTEQSDQATRTAQAPRRNAGEVSANRVNQKASSYNVQLGLGYMAKGDIQRAKRKLLMALQQAPNSPVAYDAMAFFQERVGNKKQADYYFQRAMTLAPGKGAQLNNYGTFLCRQGQFKQAEQYFMQAIKDPNYLNSPEAYENAGLCATAIPNLAQAKKYFKKALEQDPRRATSLLELAEIAFKENNYKSAQTYLLSYSKVAPATAPSVWLSYRLAKRTGQGLQLNRLAMQLKSKFANSREYKAYQSSLNS